MSRSVQYYSQRYAIWYHLHSLTNVKNTHEGVLHLVELQALVTLLHCCFSRFLNCTKGMKLPNASHMSIRKTLLTWSGVAMEFFCEILNDFWMLLLHNTEFR